MSLGSRIKELRIEKKMTQEQLGKIIGVSKVSVSGYENGTREPDTQALLTISKYFNVTTDYLLGKANTKKPSSNNKEIDIEDFVKDNGILTFEGRPIPKEDLEVLKRLTMSRKNEKEIDDDK